MPSFEELVPPETRERMLAAVDLVRRTGSSGFQLRYSDDDSPVVWMAVATYPNGGAEVDASTDPFRAVLRLAERLVDGGFCVHCRRPSGLDPDSLDAMPLDDLVCWYQFDPGAKKFIRGCA